jgi:hypothetical protein
MEIFRKDLATGLAMILAAAIGLAAFPGECLAQKPSGGIGKSANDRQKHGHFFIPKDSKASEMLPSMALLKEPVGGRGDSVWLEGFSRFLCG